MWALLMSTPTPELGAHLSEGSARGALRYSHVPAVEDNVKPQVSTISREFTLQARVKVEICTRVISQDPSRKFSSSTCCNTHCR